MVKKYSLDSEKVASASLEWLLARGVQLEEIAELVLHAQREYYPNLLMEECLGAVKRVLSKREVQNALLLGIQLDILTEEGKLLPPLLDMLIYDEQLFGCDEVLAFSIVNVYGSIGFTNYGYFDKTKPGVLARLNNKDSGEIHTFLDDLVGAVAASACSYIAHRKQAEAETLLKANKE
ncbi:MAG: phosphatidylglycerophosphatase A [Gorillibacterium sp.]|nr:phosphatidylglycerophosphatase A [Gorillibacterium sp.]